MKSSYSISIDPSDPAFFQNPYPAYDEMRAKGRAIYWDEYKLWCFPHFEEVNAILRDRRFGREITHLMSQEEAGLEPIPDHLRDFDAIEANSMLEREPPVHTRLRGLVNRAFVSRHIEQMRGDMEALCHQLIDQFPADGSFDLLPAYAEKIPVIVICRLLGVPEAMADQLLDWSHKMVAMYQFNRTRQTEDAAVAATRAFSNYIYGYINEKRAQPADDLLTRLINAEEAGDKLTTDEMISTAILLLNAGHEATVHGIGNGVKALMQACDNPGELLAKPSESGLADELLRLDPPLHMFTRFVLEDLEIGGQSFRRGDQVGLLLGAANHDPARFHQPSQLDFDRGGSGHVAFGAGIHFCVGAPLARLEMAMGLRILFNRLPNLRLADQPHYADRYHFHGLETLMVSV